MAILGQVFGQFKSPAQCGGSTTTSSAGRSSGKNKRIHPLVDVSRGKSSKGPAYFRFSGSAARESLVFAPSRRKVGFPPYRFGAVFSIQDSPPGGGRGDEVVGGIECSGDCVVERSQVEDWSLGWWGRGSGGRRDWRVGASGGGFQGGSETRIGLDSQLMERGRVGMAVIGRRKRRSMSKCADCGGRDEKPSGWR